MTLIRFVRSSCLFTTTYGDVLIDLQITRDTLTIRGREDCLLACVSTAMPDALRADLADRLVACFDCNPLRSVDSASTSGGRGTFEALHFSWYNCHCTKVLFVQFLETSNVCFDCQGNAAPTDIQPIMRRRSGRSRTNHNQFLPYMSKDVSDHAQAYLAVKKMLRNVFDWLAEKVCSAILLIMK